MNKFLVAIVLSALTLACVPKQKKVMAIDVLLTPSEEIHQLALQLNAQISRDNPKSIKLDEKHIPHITLLQCFVNESDLQEIEIALNGLFETVENDYFIADGLVYSKEHEESFVKIAIEKSHKLSKLHQETIERIKPFMISDGYLESFVQNPDGTPISDFTFTYLLEFLEKHSYENFDPHISLGVARTALLDTLSESISAPIKFQATSVSLYQLGDHGTAQKKLWKSE